MRISILLLVIVTMLAGNTKSAAQIIPTLGCNDHAIRLQAEQIKQDFKSQGMEVYKDAMLDMESKQPSPIAVQLTKGILYQMILIGSKEANKIRFELFDGEDKKIDERILKHPGLNNFLVYSFVPDKTDFYLVILSQSKGMQNLCGSFSIMQPATGKTRQQAPSNQPAKTPGSNPRYVPRGNK